MQLRAAVVDDDLLAVEVRMAERGRDIDDGARLIVLGHVRDAHKALHVGEREREERRVHRADHQARVAVAVGAGVERQHHDLLIAQPVERLLPELGELIAKAVLEAGLVGRQLVADGHAVRIAAAHIVLHEVDHAAVLAAHHLGLLDRAEPFNGIHHVVAGGVRGAVGHFLQLLLRLGVGDALALLQCLRHLGRKLKSVEIVVGIHAASRLLQK